MKNLCALLLVLSGAISVWADKLVLLNNNMDSLRARVDYIQNAEKEIRVQYFSIDKDVLSFTTLALLRDAAERGVKVRILVDSMHNSMKRETMAALTLTLHPELQPNIEIKEYNQFNLFRPFRYTKRMHDKGLIIDSKYMISGGRNIGDGYFGRYSKTASGETLPIFEDSDVLVLESKAIDEAAQYFDDLWGSKFVDSAALYEYSKEKLSPDYCRYHQDGGRNNDSFQCESKQKYDTKAVLDEEKKFDKFINDYKQRQSEEAYYALKWSDQAIDVVNIEFLHDDVKTQKSNLDKPEKNIAARLYDVISNAKKHVIIVSPYLVITPEHAALFRKLKSNNVRVQIFTNSKASNDSPPAYVGYEKSRHIALNEGVEIFEYQGPDTLHAKMVFVDDETLFIGSYNWDYRSQNLNREVGILATLPTTPSYELNVDIYEKLSRIVRNSCKTDGSACVPISNIRLADVTEEQMQRLLELNLRRSTNSSKVYRMFYSIIKGQL